MPKDIASLGIYSLQLVSSGIINLYNSDLKLSQIYMLYIINKIMRFHNSTQIPYEPPTGRKFFIRYHQQNTISTKKHKNMFTEENEKIDINNLSIAETQIYLNNAEQSSFHKPKLFATQKLKRKKTHSQTPINLIGSFIEELNSKNDKNQREEKYEKLDDKHTKQYPRIPIQFNDEKANGTDADFLRIRVIFRGYAPKNSYFFLKNLHLSTLPEERQIRNETNLRNADFQLRFDSKFESGNLTAAARKSAKQFWLFMREDTNTFGLRQWYYFSVSNRKPGKYKFKIFKFTKNYSLYKEGMKPFVCEDNTNDWKQGCQNVEYEYDENMKTYSLNFEYTFNSPNCKVLFATQPPYTYSKLKDYLALIKQRYDDLKIKKIGETLSGLDIPMITVEDLYQKRQAIVVLARTHPGETASNYSVQAFVERIMDNQQILKRFNFYIIPMVNPDGVFFGNHRTSVVGQDLNRNFKYGDIQCFPQIEAVQKVVANLKKSQQVRFLLDLHGHSAKRNIFAYGDQQKIGSKEFLHTRIIPKILSNLISSFKYNYCIFKAVKQKKNTARVFFNKKFKINSLTFEQSYGLLDNGAMGISNWRNFGTILADSLDQFRILYDEKKQEGLRDYLKDDILFEEQKIEKKRRRQQEKQRKRMQEQKREQTNSTKMKTKKSQKNSFKLDAETQRRLQKAKQLERQKQIIKQEEKESDDQINSEELDSGDEELEMKDEDLEIFKKEIIKLGCLKQRVKRQTYSVAEKKIEIRNNYHPRLHEQKIPLVSKLMKLQNRKKQYKPPLNFNMNSRERVARYQRQSIQLPFLQKQF